VTSINLVDELVILLIFVTDELVCVCLAMAGAMPQQPGYVTTGSVGGQYVGGPTQPQPQVAVPAVGAHNTVPPAAGQMPQQRGANEASLAELISFDW